MRKKVFGKKLKRDANERKALFKGLLNDLVLKERLTTTDAKATAIRGQAEKLVTKAKVKGDGARSVLSSYLIPAAVEKVITDLAVRFAKRPGGYTRLIKLQTRLGDNAPMAVLEWVEREETKGTKEPKETKAESKGVTEATAKVATKKTVTKKTTNTGKKTK